MFGPPRMNGRIPRAWAFSYVWGDALAENARRARANGATRVGVSTYKQPTNNTE